MTLKHFIAHGIVWAGAPLFALSGAAGLAAPSPEYSVGPTFTAVGGTPHFSAVDVRLHKLFVSNLARGTVTVVNSRTGKYLATIHLGGVVHTVMINQKTQRVYVTDIARGYLDVINARTNQVTAEIPVAQHLHGLAVSQRLHEAFVTDIALSRVYIVNLKTNKVLTPHGLPVGPNPWGVTVNPRTHMLYVANTGINPFSSTPVNPSGNSVTVINLRTDQTAGTITVGPHPWNLVAVPSTNQVYVGVSAANAVAVIRGMHVIKDIAVGNSPHGVAWDKNNRMLFVNNSLSNNVSLINTVQNMVTQTIPVGTQPQGISINPVTGWAYTVNQASQTVTVLKP